MSGKSKDFGIYVVDAYKGPIGSGVTGAKYCSIAGVAKTNTTEQPFLVANEFICNRLAMMLGLPVPPGVMTKGDDGQPLFLTLRIGRNGETFPPADAKAIVEDKPREAAGVVAFDAWVANEDRNSGNLLYVRSVMPLAMIDHGNALFGSHPSGKSRLPERLMEPCISAAGCLHKHVQSLDELNRWSVRIATLHDDGIEDVCSAACEYGGLTHEHAAAASAFLVQRKTRVYEFVLGSRARFPGVSQWGLT